MKVGSLQYGVIFKKAFCDTEIFKPFIDDFFSIDIQIDHVETEKSFSPPVGYVNCSFDLYAEDPVNRIILDVQHVRHFDHFHRFLYYHCIAILEQIKNSNDYYPIKSVFTLVVLTSGDKHKKDIGIIDFDPKDLQGNPFNEINHKIIYICPKYVNKDTPQPFRQWLLAIDDSLDEEVDVSKYERPEIKKIFDHIQKDHITPDERAAMIDEYSYGLLEKAAVEKGLKKGMEKGMKKGMEKGMEKGIEKGMEKGIEKGIKTVAINMLSGQAYTHDQIAKITGLSLENVRELSFSVK
jgi:predicted transposase/invertase (TIGR01784 family)